MATNGYVLTPEIEAKLMSLAEEYTTSYTA